MVLAASFTSWPNGSIDWVGTLVCASPWCGHPKAIITAAIASSGARRLRDIPVSMRAGLHETKSPCGEVFLKPGGRVNRFITRVAVRAVPEMHAWITLLCGAIAWRNRMAKQLTVAW